MFSAKAQSAGPTIAVIIPAHDPHLGRLRSTLLGLKAQTLAPSLWHAVLVNNASRTWPDDKFFADCAPDRISVVDEPNLGLSAARRRGFESVGDDLAVLVDDDNVLDPSYLSQVLAIFSKSPRMGIAGGKSIPAFEAEPPEWTREFFPLLALRDLGDREIVSAGLRPRGSSSNAYPAFAPIGAGMALRREAWVSWVDQYDRQTPISDRRGRDLSSGGDNDIVLSAMRAGWDVGYFPTLRLTHLIPTGRLMPDYLARLNRGIQQSWMQVLTRHEANPWDPLSAFGATLRKAKAWLSFRGWSRPAGRVRWQGACGHFDGRVLDRKATPIHGRSSHLPTS